jgi:diguanylate cyclase (GGDEF)-like protein/PAS domain S-box-containing protein
MLQSSAQTPSRSTLQEPADAPAPQTDDDSLSAKTAATTVAALLARYPEAPVIASAADGTVVEVPDSVPLQRNPVLRPQTGMDLVVASDRARLLAAWDQVLSTGSARSLLHMVSDPETPLMYCGFDVRETHGVILAVVVPVDPSERPVERHQEPATPRFARINKNDAGFIVKVDEAVTQILGWTPEEMEGHRSVAFIHPDDQALAIDNWLEMLASPGIGRRLRLRHRRRDDSYVWFEVTNNNLLSDPNFRCVVCEMVDLSEEMAREQLLERLAATVPVGLFQVDTDRQIVYTNGQLHKILGVERADDVAAQLETVVESDRPALWSALDAVLGRGKDAEAEVALQLPAGGGMRFCTINMRALNHDDGKISGAIACVADVTDSTRMRDELKRRATFDELTGCYNRPSIMAALEASVRSGRAQSECAVMFIDLDRFKEVNDREGHAAGDELLKVVAERLRRVVRGDDLVGRIGGDEFLVVCPEIGGHDQAMRLAERISEALRTDIRLAGVSKPHQLRASIGVALSEGDGLGADLLVAQADSAMYESKHERAGEPRLAAAA